MFDFKNTIRADNNKITLFNSLFISLPYLTSQPSNKHVYWDIEIQFLNFAGLISSLLVH